MPRKSKRVKRRDRLKAWREAQTVGYKGFVCDRCGRSVPVLYASDIVDDQALCLGCFFRSCRLIQTVVS